MLSAVIAAGVLADGVADAVAQEPGRFVGDFQFAMDLMGGDALLRSAHHVNGEEPLAERDLEALEQLRGVDLLIVDESGFVPFDRAGGEILFHALADRYERRSTVATTNLAFSEWVQVFGDEKLTTALLDRLSHHAHILTPKGRSFRTRDRKGNDS